MREKFMRALSLEIEAAGKWPARQGGTGFEQGRRRCTQSNVFSRAPGLLNLTLHCTNADRLPKLIAQPDYPTSKELP
jgi:hypothetical protein